MSVCLGGRLDVVFLVPASTDRLNLAQPLRKLLTSVAGSLHTIGARDSQVLAKTWAFWMQTASILSIFSLFQMGVVVYGYRPKIWFLLNRHERSDTLLQEIQSTPFDESPGNNIGQFLDLIWLKSLCFKKHVPCMCWSCFCVSLCRWSGEVHHSIPPESLGRTEAEGPWCCRYYRRRKISWQPLACCQQSQGYRWAH